MSKASALLSSLFVHGHAAMETLLRAASPTRISPQQRYQKRLRRPEVQKRLSPRLRRILALDDARNDELSSNVGRTSGFLK